MRSTLINTEPQSVLITGGIGFIGSYTALAFLEAGYNVTIVDNLSNSSEEVLRRLELICAKKAHFYNVDVTDEPALDRVFREQSDLACVIHLAGLKAIGVSSKEPLRFYDENVYGTMVVLKCMVKHKVRTLLFASSSTTYGDITIQPNMVPVNEECPLLPINPYGHTKVMSETIIKHTFEAKNREEEAAQSGNYWNAGLLRYFNPCGAHPSGILGEDPHGGLHLIPVLAHIALGKIESLGIYGGDYETRDGTMIRDYIHVLDLAQGHISALKHLQSANPGVRAWNFGSGRGVTVYEALEAFSKVLGRKLPSFVGPRRPEYVPDLTADSSRAKRELNWIAKRSLEDCCRDFWLWTTNNPDGYNQKPPEHLLQALQKGH